MGDANELAVAYRSDASGDGIKTSWWLRSRYASTASDRYASHVASSGVLGAADASYDTYSVAPAFTLNTDPEGPNLRDDNPQDPGQPDDPGSGDDSGDDSGSSDDGSHDHGTDSSRSAAAAVAAQATMVATTETATTETVAEQAAADTATGETAAAGDRDAEAAARQELTAAAGNGNTAVSSTGDDSMLQVYAVMAAFAAIVLATSTFAIWTANRAL